MAQLRGLVNTVKSKLGLIKSQRDDLNGLLNGYVDQVASKATDALEDENQDLNILREMNSRLETVLGFLLGLSGEVEDHMSGSAAKPSDLHQSKSATSLSGASSEKPKQEFTSGRSLSALNVTDSSDISRLSQRVDMIELAMKGYSADNKNLLEKLTDIEKKQDTRLESVENCVAKLDTDNKNMEEKLNEIETNQETRLDDMDEKMQEMNMEHQNAYSESISRVEKVGKRLKKMESSKERDGSNLETLVESVETLKNKQQQQSSKLNKIDKQVESLTGQFTSLKDATADVHLVKKDVEAIKSKMNTFAEKGDLSDCFKATRTVSQSLQEISHRMDVTESSVKSLISYREEDENKKEELEKRMSVLESNRRKDRRYFVKELGEVQSLYRQVCCLVDGKVEPLRHLLRILNDYHKRVESRESLAQRLDTVADEVNNLASKVGNLESAHPPGPVGFSAWYPVGFTPVSEGQTKDFRRVRCNEGNCYDQNSGRFTAPRDGLYVTSLSVAQAGEGKVGACVMHSNSSGGVVSYVCYVETNTDRDQGCNVEVVKMKAGDTLDVIVYRAEGGAGLNGVSSFSCFLVG